MELAERGARCSGWVDLTYFVVDCVLSVYGREKSKMEKSGKGMDVVAVLSIFPVLSVGKIAR